MTMKATPATRRKARHYGMQALYQWQMTKKAANHIEAEFRSEYDMTHVDTEYLHEIISKVIELAEELDEKFAPFLQDRSLKELDPITLSLLRLASYEFLHRIDVPYKVVINEAVALGKKFGANDSFKFINGVLDRMAPEVRQVEVAAAKS